MNEKNFKLGAALILSTVSITAFFAVTKTQDFLSAKGASFSSIYYHYEEKPASFLESGIKEYWTDCRGVTTTEKPTGVTIKEAYTDYPLISESDERYIPVKTIAIVTEEISNPELTKEEKQEIIEETKIEIQDSFGVILDDTLTKVMDIEDGHEVITIPEGVTEVLNWFGVPFKNLNSLERAYIPDTVVSLPYGGIFDNCPNLTEVTFACQSMNGNEVIKNCPNVKTINIKSTVNHIDGYAFVNMGNTTAVINCQRASEPAGYATNWNAYNYWPADKYTTYWDVRC